MADLIVIGYDSKEKAEQVLDELLELNRDYLVDLQDAAVVYRNEKGKLKVTHPGNPTAQGALGGAFWGRPRAWCRGRRRSRAGTRGTRPGRRRA